MPAVIFMSLLYCSLLGVRFGFVKINICFPLNMY
nr:MAG TPA: hypothetical protein [Caudoviricetes sp.]